MNTNSGKVIYRKSTAYSDPATSNGKRAVNNIMINIITLNAIIRYLNFTKSAPKISNWLNNKRKLMLRQRDKYLDKSEGKYD